MSKQKLHNKILVVLSSGKQVSIEDIKASFASDAKASALLYRLSTYIYDARKYDNAVIKVFKDGRKVTGYQLVNFSDYNSEGFYSPKAVEKTEGHQEPVQA